MSVQACRPLSDCELAGASSSRCLRGWVASGNGTGLFLVEWSDADKSMGYGIEDGEPKIMSAPSSLLLSAGTCVAG